MTVEAEPTLEERARDAHDADRWPDNPDGSPHKWGSCNETHRQRYRDFILRAEREAP